jgi:hypothetical protein
LQRDFYILQVPVAFFFERAQLHGSSDGAGGALAGLRIRFSRNFRGLSLTKAFMRIKEPKLERRIVDLVERSRATPTTERDHGDRHLPGRFFASFVSRPYSVVPPCHILTPFSVATKHFHHQTIGLVAIESCQGVFSVSHANYLFTMIRL